MKTKLFLSVSAAFLAVVLVAGCVSTNSATGGVNLKTKDVRFKSEAGSLTISNETSSDVVIFVGRVEKNAVIGGIKANEQRTFDLSKVPGIPDTGSLLIRAATFETYKGRARVTEDDVIYTGLVVYNLKDKTKPHKTQ